MTLQSDILHSASRTYGCRIMATDGEVGRLKDLYFDDRKWAIRYLVVHTGSWLSERCVLVSPHAVRFVDPPSRLIVVSLSRDRVASGPPVDARLPLSRVQEADFHSYFGYPMYWPGIPYWPQDGTSAAKRFCGTRFCAPSQAAEQSMSQQESELHSARSIEGFQVTAQDGSLGRVDDIFLDERTWAIRHVMVSTRGWLPGRYVRIAPEWIQSVSWTDRCATVGVERAALRRAADRSRRPAAEL